MTGTSFALLEVTLGGLLHILRMGTGHWEDQDMMRSLEFSAPHSILWAGERD